MTDWRPWLEAVRESHERLAGLTDRLSLAELQAQSACSAWTVAQVLSHLGSQAGTFSLFVEAGVTGSDLPSHEAFGPIWEEWNAKSPEAQARDSIQANEALLGRLEDLDAPQLNAFRLEMFGRTVDAAALLRMRLSEHALHTWDVEVVRHGSASIAPTAVDLLVDGLAETAARAGKPPSDPLSVEIDTTSPTRQFLLITAGGVVLEPRAGRSKSAARLRVPAEALVRLIFGRLDAVHPAGGDVDAEGVSFADLIPVFPGF